MSRGQGGRLVVMETCTCRRKPAGIRKWNLGLEKGEPHSDFLGSWSSCLESLTFHQRPEVEGVRWGPRRTPTGPLLTDSGWPLLLRPQTQLSLYP